MKPSFIVLGVAVALGLVIVSGLWGWDGHLRRELHATYGPAPALGATFVSPSEGSCQKILSVSPPTHYTWLGRIWQEESLDWSDVQIQHPPPREFAHNHSGSVKVGDVICGFGEVSDIRYVHRPTGIILTETCESYRCPLE